jgi:hypothetical protein
LRERAGESDISSLLVRTHKPGHPLMERPGANQYAGFIVANALGDLEVRGGAWERREPQRDRAGEGMPESREAAPLASVSGQLRNTAAVPLQVRDEGEQLFRRVQVSVED